MSQILETWYLDTSPSRTFHVTGGTGSTVDATAAQLRDGSDSTADSVTANGDGVSLGRVDKYVTFTLGASAIAAAGTIEFVRILMRGRVTGDPGSTPVIHALYDGDTMPGAVLPDDYLSEPPAAFVFNWNSHDYMLDPRTGEPWDRARITSLPWGFLHLLETFTENDSNTMEISEYRVELWGQPLEPIMPNEPSGTSPMMLDVGYLTDIIPSRTGAEQRVQLRAVPRRAVEFPVLAADAFESQAAIAALYPNQGGLVTVPLWPYTERLTAQAALGATSFSVSDTANVPWEAGSKVLLWLDPLNNELLPLSSAGGGVVTTSAPSGRIWPVGTLLVPALSARSGGEQALERPTGHILTTDSAFEMEINASAALPSPPAAGTTYQSIEVLTLPLEQLASDPESLQRPLLVMKPLTTLAYVERPTVSPRSRRTLTWTCFSRSHAKDLVAFVDRRRGRLKPFWLPSGRHDVSLAQDAASGAGSVRVWSSGYGAAIWPLGPYRRHLALRRPSGAYDFRKVTAVTQNLDGTETLTLSSTLSAALPMAGSMVSHLILYRLDEDLVRIAFRTVAFAEAQFPLLELPAEVPA